jgi:large subunit ribosomal protein L29
MKIQDLRSKDAAGLTDDLAKLKKEQFNLRFQQATGQLEKPSRMREVRRDIARVKTALREKRPAQTV